MAARCISYRTREELELRIAELLEAYPARPRGRPRKGSEPTEPASDDKRKAHRLIRWYRERIKAIDRGELWEPVLRPAPALK